MSEHLIFFVELIQLKHLQRKSLMDVGFEAHLEVSLRESHKTAQRMLSIIHHPCWVEPLKIADR